MKSESKLELVAGLEIGGGRVTCIVGSVMANGVVKVIGGSSVVCRGIKGGIVINIIETAAAVKRAVQEAAASADGPVSRIWLGVRGSHLQSFNTHGTYKVAPTASRITAEGVDAVIASAKAFALSPDRQILNAFPQGFSIDHEANVPNPLGMVASQLDVDVHLVTASRAHLNNAMTTVTQAGFEVIVPMYGLRAVAELLISREEKERGCVIVDFGGQTISLGFYCDGAIAYSKEIAFGSDLITRDLAIGLKTSFPTAEKIKLNHGVAYDSSIADVDIECPGDEGSGLLRTKKSTILGIVGPRVEEIFSIVNEDLRNSPYFDLIVPGNAILTGGGSLMPGMVDAAQRFVEMSVRLGKPPLNLVQADEKWLSPAYSTALGLLYCSRETQTRP